jgi:predicted lipoprotein with Yx(FWY)xxD motif
MLRHRTTLMVMLGLLALALGWVSLGSPAVHAGQGQAGSAAATSVKVTTIGAFGPVLTDMNGLTLYTFILDSSNVSNCNDQCARVWPPALVQGPVVAPSGLPGTLGSAARSDGTMQLTYQGWPLYNFARDSQPGQTSGDGSLNSGGLWPIAATGAVAPTIQYMQDSQGQYILTNSSGMTLYTHSNDPQDQSLCTDPCTTNWPPAEVVGDLVIGPGLSRVVSKLTRDDGSAQLAYKHQALYAFAKDKQPGDETGQGLNGFGGQWAVAVLQVVPTPTP